MADKNTEVVAEEIMLHEENEAKEVEATIEESKDEKKPFVFDFGSRAGKAIDKGANRVLNFGKKHWKKAAVGAGAVALAVAGAKAIDEIDRRFPIIEEPMPPKPILPEGYDYDKAEQAGIDAFNAELDRQEAEVSEVPFETEA